MKIACAPAYVCIMPSCDSRSVPNAWNGPLPVNEPHLQFRMEQGLIISTACPSRARSCVLLIAGCVLAAPEALMSRRAEGTVDEAATAWICGVFLYCMLCNQYPVRVCPGHSMWLVVMYASVHAAFLPHLQTSDSVYVTCL